MVRIDRNTQGTWGHDVTVNGQRVGTILDIGDGCWEGRMNVRGPFRSASPFDSALAAARWVIETHREPVVDDDEDDDAPGIDAEEARAARADYARDAAIDRALEDR